MDVIFGKDNFGIKRKAQKNTMLNESRDPWNRGEKRGEQPPDLDEVFGKMLGAVSRLFGGGKPPSNGGGGGSGKSAGSDAKKRSIAGVVIGILVLVWLFSGFYIVGEGTRGVELRFSAYSETTTPGPHWHFPFPFETVEKVDIDSIRSVQNKARMLTQDENIVEVEVAVQYRVLNASDYLFNVRFPDAPPGGRPNDGAVFQVMESALRDVVGKAKMDFLLGAGRAEVAGRTKDLMQQILDAYKSGIQIINVNLQQSQPPTAVQDAFADAIKAREDEIRYVNEAETYANGVIPRARGEKARMLEEAEAYREKVIANSKGEASRFIQLHEEYAKAPEVTRKRLYLQAVEEFLKDTRKVVMDADGGNSLFYLPLDQILKNEDNDADDEADTMDADSPAQNTPPARSFDNLRRRGSRR